MDSFADTIVDFVRARQVNIAMAGLLTILYLLYQYWNILFKPCEDELGLRQSRISRSPSRSRSRSRSGYKLDNKTSYRGRKPHRRCPDCSLCNNNYEGE